MTDEELEQAIASNESMTVLQPFEDHGKVFCNVEIAGEVIIGNATYRFSQFVKVELKKFGTLVDPFANIRKE